MYTLVGGSTNARRGASSSAPGWLGGPLSEANIELDQLRAYLRETGAGALTVDDLRESDLPSIGWSGNPAHLRSVGEKLSAAARGELDYLAVRAPDGTPLAKGAVEYGSRKDGGEIGQGQPPCARPPAYSPSTRRPPPACTGTGTGTGMRRTFRRASVRRCCRCANPAM
jgi:hypothetical protein